MVTLSPFPEDRVHATFSVKKKETELVLLVKIAANSDRSSTSEQVDQKLEARQRTVLAHINHPIALRIPATARSLNMFELK